jgi:hypothetical protein
MNRPLALYLLILDFFLLLIAGAEAYLLRSQTILWRTDFLFAVSAIFVCPVCSVIYIFQTRKSFPSPEPETSTQVIDDLPSDEVSRSSPIPNWVRALGLLCSFLAIAIFAETCYGLLQLYQSNALLLQFRTNSSLSVVFVVLLFNALCQPWYVWRTFLNVKM